MQNVIEIVRRRVRLRFEPHIARRWSAMPRSTEDCLNALSSLFPTGEAFFCRSVAYYRDKITNPVLREQVAQFIHQEAMHSKEHARANAALREANVLGAETESAARSMLWFTERFSPPAYRLAVTCALEHLTTILCAELLGRRWPREETTDKEFANLWLWHAAEEIEHKAVCFDVYTHVYGAGVWPWLLRCLAMGLVTLTGGIGIFIAFCIASIKNMKRGRRAPKKDEVAANAVGPSFQAIVKGISLAMYFDFYRRDFHPSKHDHSALLEAWKHENPGFGLNHGHKAA